MKRLEYDFLTEYEKEFEGLQQPEKIEKKEKDTFLKDAIAYTDLEKSQYKSVGNTEKTMLFKVMCIRLEALAKAIPAKLKIEHDVDSMTANIELKFLNMFYNSDDECNYTGILSQILLISSSFSVIVEREKYIVMNFNILLYDELKVADFKDELEKIKQKMLQ